jgi:hypothetical protein
VVKEAKYSVALFFFFKLSIIKNRGENVDVDAVITFRYLCHAVTIRICAVIKCGYYPLPAYEVIIICKLK